MTSYNATFTLMLYLFTNFLFMGVLLEESRTYDLIEHLLSIPYDSTMKPSDNLTTVTVTPNTFILLSMDQQQETILFSQEFLLTWFDPIMHWDPNNVSYERNYIKLPAEKIWLPDTIFTNAIEMTNFLSPDIQTVDMYYTGRMRTSFPGIIQSPCPLNIANFPYDVQECDIKIGPWNYDWNSVVVQTNVTQVLPINGRFQGNSEWELISIKSSRSDNYDDTLEAWFSEITFTVKLKRKPVYYVLVIQAPTFILCTLTIFGIFTPNSNEDERRTKVELSLNMFAAISMMLNLVSDMMPKASRLPLLGNYIIAEVFVVTGATLASIVVQLIHQQVYTTAISPPKWLQKIIFFDCCKRRQIQSISQIETARSVTIPAFMAEISAFDMIKESIQKTVSRVQSLIERTEKSENNRLIWLKILDRLDILLLILFQAANIVVTAIFWR